jgi:transcriptional regulator with XRE-family HTH domain
MSRPKTIPELRQEIQASAKLQADSQGAISEIIGLNQATVSRILRGQFKRRSKAVDKILAYAEISCITESPLTPFEVTVTQLEKLAAARSPNGRHAAKLIRLAAELIESSLPPAGEHVMPEAQPSS